ncbi:hypothetical protein HCK01_23115 [Streptomyces sp. AA8]|uniref:DUF6415 family natural product biosynthesis protein n=1 Tax=Streptomyces telluris TaxID=2720021 RepID=UPI0014393E8B|nr:DUF6415 family natural product biosynthesis protein [Streptomyces telluris]NJP80163.1 hypothetical protein [Streptomyces telluris]
MATTAGHYVARVNGPDGQVPIDVERIRQTIREALRPTVEGIRVDPEKASNTMTDLAGQIALLLPAAEARYRVLRPDGSPYDGMLGADFDALQRRLGYERPSPHQYPLNASVWMADLARSCQTLLGLVLDAQQAVGDRHTAAAR